MPVTLLLCATACSTTSEQFVERQPSYSVTKGRLIGVEGLNSSAVTNLADGVAFQVTAGICRVTLELDDDSERTLQLQSPAMLVCGPAGQYVLQPVESAAPEPAR